MAKRSKQNMEDVLNGFFYALGFIDNPAKKQVEKIRKTSSAQKMREDLRKVNSDYRKTYQKLKEEILCIE